MNSRRWTEDEVRRALAQYEAGLSAAEIAQMLGRSESSLRYKLYSLGYSTARIEPGLEDVADARPVASAILPSRPVEEDEAFYEEKARRELELSEMRRSEREKVEDAKRAILEDRIIEEFRRSLCDLPRSFAYTPPAVKSGVPDPAQIGVLVVSDVHVGQVVDPCEVEGLGTYNPAVTLSRVHHLENEVRRILRDRPIEKLLLLFGGDILHGRLGHSLEDDLTVPIAQQADLALNIFFPFVRGLAAAVPKLEIHGVAGNHGRWPGMRKMPTDRRWSNLDTIFYQSLSALCQHAGLTNVEWDERISSRRTIDAGAFRIQLVHGDEIRGGAFCAGGMSREVHQATLRSVQHGRRPADLFVMGDKHFTASIPFGSGAFVVNGSCVGVDGFGLNFVPSPPSQTLFFLHHQHGKTETHEIRLGHAKMPSPLPYNLKPSLEQLVQSHL